MKKLIFFAIFSFLRAQGEVQVLSPRVGTEIDVHENRFYRIFPREKGFVSAQILTAGPNEFRVKIIKEINGQRIQKTSTFTLRKFIELQTHVNGQPELTEEALNELYKGMHFLQAAKIVTEIPKPQFVKIKHSGGKKLKGTLLSFENEILQVQTPTTVDWVPLDRMEKISYRITTGDYLFLKPYIFAISAALGFGIGQVYNSQRNPETDIKWYNRFYGTIIGLIFSGELFDAVSTLLTPKETFILAEEEYERLRTQ